MISKQTVFGIAVIVMVLGAMSVDAFLFDLPEPVEVKKPAPKKQEAEAEEEDDAAEASKKEGGKSEEEKTPKKDEPLKRVYTKKKESEKGSVKGGTKTFNNTLLIVNPNAPQNESDREKLFAKIYPKLQQRIGGMKGSNTSKIECIEIQNDCAARALHCNETEAFDEHRCFGSCRSCVACFNTKSLNFEKRDMQKKLQEKPLLGGKQSNMIVTAESYKKIFNEVVNTFKCKACVTTFLCHPNVCHKITPPTCNPGRVTDMQMDVQPVPAVPKE